MDLSDITPLIITFDEISNIRRTVAALQWAQEIVVVDSGSSDGTLEFLRGDSRVDVVVRKFDDFAAQCTHGLRCVKTQFTLSIDADHIVTPELEAELRRLNPGTKAAWRVPFRYCIDGTLLRASLLPPRVALFRTSAARYENDGHAHRVVVSGEIGDLRSPLLHDDRKPAHRWYAAQRRYAPREAAKLRQTRWKDLNWPDRARRLFLGPPLIAAYCLLGKGLLLDGVAGLKYCWQRVYAEMLLVHSLLRKTR